MRTPENDDLVVMGILDVAGGDEQEVREEVTNMSDEEYEAHLAEWQGGFDL